jgi:8-oxo-dGTP diphosphatase
MNKEQLEAKAEANKLRMVLGFMFNENETDVLLIQKSKPDWQDGKFNGIGGKCDEGEGYHKAMCREFKEETGIEYENWRQVTVMSGDDWIVAVFTAQSDDVFNYRTMESEPVCLIPIRDLDQYDHIANLQWLIPMCLDAFLDYSVCNTESESALSGIDLDQVVWVSKDCLDAGKVPNWLKKTTIRQLTSK